jgi:hypothetical protein
MLDPVWMILSCIALFGGAMVILTPNVLLRMNNHLAKALVSVDDLVLKYRHVVGAMLLIVAYLCFRLALLIPTGGLQ